MFGFGKKHKAALAQKPAMTSAEPPDSAPEAKKSWLGSLFKGEHPQETPPETPAAPPRSKPAVAAPVPPPEEPPVFAPSPLARAQETPEDFELPDLLEEEPEPAAEETGGFLSRLRAQLSRSRSHLGEGLGTLVLGRKKIDDELLEEIETLLITADVGIDATSRIIEDLTERVRRKALADPQELLKALKDELRAILAKATGPVRQPSAGKPQVILMVGVNGAGKTTTIGKLAKRLQEEGNKVMLAAGDTFRAAAVEQLQTWGERNHIPVIAQHTGADSASVIYDALQAATSREFDVLIADTAGRLHTKSNLMEELTKVVRVMRKIDPEAPHEVMLVVDAATGQNALHQAEHFHKAVGLTGITLTKLDGTAKGGIVFAIAEHLQVPIRFIGIGESISDLRYFEPDDFIDALLG